MKMLDRDYNELALVCSKVINDNLGVRQAYLKANASFARFSWDVLHRSKYDLNRLYHYLNDSHIDTALAKILDKTSYNKGI